MGNVVAWVRSCFPSPKPIPTTLGGSGGGGSSGGAGGNGGTNDQFPLIVTLIIFLVSGVILCLFFVIPTHEFVKGFTGIFTSCGMDMDKTCTPDLALESLGAVIISTRNTEPAPPKVTASIFGIPIASKPGPPPETILRYRLLEPGNCWAFKGSKGRVVIQLAKPAKICGFHLEHIHKSIDPFGKLGNAPQHFQIWGLRDLRLLDQGEEARKLIGNYTFTPLANPLQYFPVQQNAAERFGQIELDVLTNHGDNITCIYRIRVHGTTRTRSLSAVNLNEH